MWNPFQVKESAVVEVDYKPTISEYNVITEQFKGKVEQQNIKFPNELGEEHPFDFLTLENLYKKFGLFNAIVDKYVDFVWGAGFYVTCDDERAKKIIDDFMRDVNFDTLGRAWTKEAMVKGNGFLELGGKKDGAIDGLKVLNANYMYVVRDNKGVIKGYNQYVGGFEKFAKEKVISFKPWEIAHVPFNIVGNSAYGLGIGYPALVDSNNLIQNEKSNQLFIKRKAESKLHAKLGKVDGNVKIIPKKEDVTAFGKKMETMDNKTNWATDDLVDLSVVDFGNAGDRFTKTLEYDINKLIYVFQVPGVLLGMSNINMGIAKVEMEGFQKRIQSIRQEFEKIIENQIFKRVLEANGLDVHVEFEWGTASVMEMDARLKTVSELVKSPTTSMAMKMVLEDELISILELDEDKWEQAKVEAEKKVEEERKREEERPQPIVPGQNAKFPQKVAPKAKQPIQPKPVTQQVTQYLINGLISDIEAREDVKSLIPKMDITVVETIPTKIDKVSIVKREGKGNYEYEKECKHCEESWNDVNDIQEWLGFNYKEYLGQILNVLGVYEFSQIKAVNEIELEAGLLTGTQVNELRNVLEDGFKKGTGMKEMAKQVDKKVRLKDLYMMSDGKIKLGASGLPRLSRSAEKRSIAIVRSEVTNMANAGAEQYYKENGIKQVSWVASFGTRTCPDCEELDGQIFNVGEGPRPALHPLCRCTTSPVVELK